MDIVRFLNDRIDEDEAVARAAIIPAHDGPNAYKPHPELAEFYDGDEVEYVQTPEMLAHKYPDRLYVTADSEGLVPAVDGDVGPHIARHDPARALREVEAKRRNIGRHPEILSICQSDGEAFPCRTHEALVDIYADHEDFQSEWR